MMIPSAQTPKPDEANEEEKVMEEEPKIVEEEPKVVEEVKKVVEEVKKPVRNNAQMMRENAMKAVARFNKQLNIERVRDRSCSMDLQTYSINYPVGIGINQKQYYSHFKRYGQWMPNRTVGKFPIALVPEQYQDNYEQYSSSKMSELPLKKAKLYPKVDKNNLPKNLSQMQAGDYYDFSDSDDDIENCDCHIDNDKKPQVPEVGNNDDVFKAALAKLNLRPSNPSTDSSTGTPSKSGSLSNSTTQPSTNLLPLNIPADLGPLDPNDCRICKSPMTVGSLLKCSDCGIASHAACLSIYGELLEAIRLYSWQCTECKVCSQCRQPHDEAKMMFCDKCDRGYHNYCVGVETIPEGHWVCQLCAFCAHCGTKTLPKINNILTDWHHEVIKLNSPDGTKFERHQVYCYPCHMMKKK